MVLQSVLCSLQATIYGNNTSLDWMQHSSWKEDMVLSPLSNPDPYSRRHNLQSHISAPSCYLPVQEDWIYLLVSLLVLPSLPFLLIFVWFLSGLCKHVSYSSQLCEIRAEILSCKRRPSLPKRLSTISSEYSTTPTVKHLVIRVNGSDKTTCRSYPTSDPRHKRRNVSQWLEKSRKQHRQTKKPSALLHVDPANQLFSDGVSVNSSSTFDLTSVSEKEAQAICDPILWYSWTVYGIIAEQLSQQIEINRKFAEQWQEFQLTRDNRPTTADFSAPEHPRNSSAQVEGESESGRELRLLSNKKKKASLKSIKLPFTLAFTGPPTQPPGTPTYFPTNPSCSSGTPTYSTGTPTY
uniref:Uncharacterized protein n=1 Tax=Ditylenchus dipsaci TaxID=166011 RepID=A0A915EEF0_9BILA